MKRLENIECTENSIDQRALGTASAFGSMIRGRRKALKMRQDQLALASGVGRRFLIELEAGKPSCQLGRSLLVAEALGLTFADILACLDRSGDKSGRSPALSVAGLPELPDALPDLADDIPGLSDTSFADTGLADTNLADTNLADLEEADGRPAGIF